jgi:hypothetical protein
VHAGRSVAAIVNDRRPRAPMPPRAAQRDAASEQAVSGRRVWRTRATCAPLQAWPSEKSAPKMAPRLVAQLLTAPGRAASDDIVREHAAPVDKFDPRSGNVSRRAHISLAARWPSPCTGCHRSRDNPRHHTRAISVNVAQSSPPSSRMRPPASTQQCAANGRARTPKTRFAPTPRAQHEPDQAKGVEEADIGARDPDPPALEAVIRRVRSAAFAWYLASAVYARLRLPIQVKARSSLTAAHDARPPRSPRR